MLSKRLTCLILLTMFFGSLNTISLKIQDNQNVTVGGNFSVRYFHPFILTVLLFVGQALVYFLEVGLREKGDSWLGRLFRGGDGKGGDQELEKIKLEEKASKPEAPLSQILIPTVLDIFTNIFANFALNLVDGSIWQLTKGGQIITTAILSKFLLKRVFTHRQILGCSLAFLGITSVQVVSFLIEANSQQSQSNGNPILVSFLLLLVALVCNSLSLIAEKDIFNRYYIQPLRMVYLEGFIGTVLMFVIAFAFQYVQCPWSDLSQCVCITPTQCYLQNFPTFLTGLFSSPLLILLILCYLASIIATTSIGTILTKDVSPVARTMANMTRTVIVWLFNLMVTVGFGADPQYRLESLGFWSNLSKVGGFLGLGFGMVVYISKDKDKDKDNEEEGKMEDNTNYQTLNPQTQIQMKTLQK